ncbi:MAG: bifunctional folylpolyglutamate synthase/dihydrofolate synthase [Myxococcales bacterium]|nr:bifunctional folylpolyglutamate synthase/dihydrofolate synthase [Myxococcales bacterium]
MSGATESGGGEGGDRARYARALGRLQALARFGVRPGLAAIARVLAALGHPERGVPALHIAGTNGKGSTAAFAEALLRAAGARTGLYTSPHLSRFTERIRIGGTEVGPGHTADLIERVLAAPGGDQLTFFEVATAAAFACFAEERVDLAVIEVGLGGRYDATSCCAPFATVVTGIGLDHTAQLGATTAAIAVEKVGIARPGVPLCAGPLDQAAGAVVEEGARTIGAPLYRFGVDFTVAAESDRIAYLGPGGPLADARIALPGAHQARNAALALAATSFAPRFAPDEAARREGLGNVRWPGRLERVAPDLILDGAHNPDGAVALAAALVAEVGPRGGRRLVLLVGALADKDARGLLAPLLPLAARVVCTRPDSPRALAASELAAQVAALAPALPVESVQAPAEALACARRGGGLVVACGSLLLVGELRRLVTGEESDPVTVADPLPPRR